MSTIAASKISAPSFVGATASPAGIVETAHRLAPKLAARAAEIDQNDRFVSANYSLLKEAGLVVQRHSELTPLRHEELTPMPIALQAVAG